MNALSKRRGGFTLIEAVVSMLLSSLVIILVATTFLVQNQYYATQLQRTGAQDNARAATELMATEIRSVMDDGIVVAGPQTLTVRSPIVLAAVCNGLPNQSFVHSPGGEAAVDTVEIPFAAALSTSPQIAFQTSLSAFFFSANTATANTSWPCTSFSWFCSTR